MLYFGYCRVVHSAGFLLAVAADERNCRALFKHQGAVLHLPGLAVKPAGDGVDV